MNKRTRVFYRCSHDAALYVKKTRLFQKLVAAAVMTREVSKLIMEHFTGICQFAGRHSVGKQPHPVIGREVTDVSQHLQSALALLQLSGQGRICPYMFLPALHTSITHSQTCDWQTPIPQHGWRCVTHTCSLTHPLLTCWHISWFLKQLCRVVFYRIKMPKKSTKTNSFTTFTRSSSGDFFFPIKEQKACAFNEHTTSCEYECCTLTRQKG